MLTPVVGAAVLQAVDTLGVTRLLFQKPRRRPNWQNRSAKPLGFSSLPFRLRQLRAPLVDFHHHQPVPLLHQPVVAAEADTAEVKAWL